MKSRLWSFVFYPESMPEDWKNILEMSGFQIAVSPLHDKDVTSEGELKKAHYHIIVYNQNELSHTTIQRLAKRLNAPPLVKVARSRDGLYNYLNHKNAQDKYQYTDEPLLINDFDINKIPEVDVEASRDLLAELLQWIELCNIIELSDLVNFIKDDRQLLDYTMKKITFVNSLIRSRRYNYKPLQQCQEVVYDDFIEIT